MEEGYKLSGEKELKLMAYIDCQRPSCISPGSQGAYRSTKRVNRNEADLIQAGKLRLNCNNCHQPANTTLEGTN